MKYRALLIATAVAAWAMRLADSVTTVAVRSAKAADNLSVKAEGEAYKVRYEAFIRQQAALQDAYFVMLNDIETARIKHSRVITDEEGDDVPVAN